MVGSENAGMSSEKSGENPDRRIPKVSSAIFVNGGLIGSKVSPPRSGGVADVQVVYIRL